MDSVHEYDAPNAPESAPFPHALTPQPDQQAIKETTLIDFLMNNRNGFTAVPLVKAMAHHDPQQFHSLLHNGSTIELFALGSTVREQVYAERPDAQGKPVQCVNDAYPYANDIHAIDNALHHLHSGTPYPEKDPTWLSPETRQRELATFDRLARQWLHVHPEAESLGIPIPERLRADDNPK